jgi:hypothetical protein
LKKLLKKYRVKPRQDRLPEPNTGKKTAKRNGASGVKTWIESSINSSRTFVTTMMAAKRLETLTQHPPLTAGQKQARQARQSPQVLRKTLTTRDFREAILPRLRARHSLRLKHSGVRQKLRLQPGQAATATGLVTPMSMKSASRRMLHVLDAAMVTAGAGVSGGALEDRYRRRIYLPHLDR